MVLVGLSLKTVTSSKVSTGSHQSSEVLSRGSSSSIFLTAAKLTQWGHNITYIHVSYPEPSGRHSRGGAFHTDIECSLGRNCCIQWGLG